KLDAVERPERVDRADIEVFPSGNSNFRMETKLVLPLTRTDSRKVFPFGLSQGKTCLAQKAGRGPEDPNIGNYCSL
ncbi:MAG: hypothetical protein C0407_14120, partial [Desulfobacca sp.]|nr:hypothetical protein [Desulfobacca sp.]